MAYLEETDYESAEESAEEESSSDEDERPVKEARKDAVYNVAGLHEKLEEMGWPEDVEWMQSVAITYPDTGNAVDVNDDLFREMSFYTQALEGARDAYQKFQALGVRFQRPTDYYAEMVKTDTHMLKIKDKLLKEKVSLEEMDERRKSREVKKFAKEVQAEKLKERSKRKKEDIESVKKWRKVRQKSGFTEGGDEAPPIEFDSGKKSKQFGKSSGRGRDRELSKNRQFRDSKYRNGGDEGSHIEFDSGKSRQFGKSSGRGRGRGRDREPPKSRQFRDLKYGNGGRKSDKRNNAESSADESTFRASFKGAGRGTDKGRGRGGGSFRGRAGSRGRGSSRGSSRGRGRGRG